MRQERGIVVEVDAPRAVVDEFRNGVHVQMQLAKMKQQRINEDCRRMKARLMPGLGQVICSVDPDVYFAMRHMYGAECWRDKDFLKSCVRHGTVEKPKVEKPNATIVRP